MKFNFAVVFIFACFVALSGCSTVETKELSAQDGAMINGKSVVLTKYNDLPGFSAQTAVNVQFGLVGYATAVSNGNAMIVRGGIVDPALAISQELARGLSETHGVKVVSAGEHVPVKISPRGLSQIYSTHDFVLDVKTTRWGSIYFVSDWNSYRVFYAAHARLIDAKSGRIVAEVLCRHLPEYEDTNKAYSYDDLESGVGLRKALDESANYCADQIRQEIKLGVVTPG